MIATGLAEAATARGKKTIFLDMDTPVGDALRVFGISDPGPYPTLSSLKVYHDPWKHSIRSKSGTFILPKPENPQDIITRSDAQKLIKECRGFDLIIADLGSDFSQPAWSLFVEKADLRLLVVDCDEKAVVRVREFLSKTSDQYDWTLVINQREEKGYYTPRQITRMLKDETIVKTVITAPYIKYITERQPQTFSPDHIFAKGILDSVWAFNAIIHTPSRPSTEPPDAPTSETVSTADSEPKILDEIINTTSPSSTESEISINDNKEVLGADKPASFDSTVIKQPQVVEAGEFNYKPDRRLGWFKKAGIISQNRFLKINCTEAEDINIDFFEALVIPASWGIEFVEKFRKKNALSTVVVIKGNKDFITAGADKCVSRVTPEVIEEVNNLIKRTKKTWTDSLTGVYTRPFLDKWIQFREGNGQSYALAMLDIDYFKSVNDTYGHPVGDRVLSSLGTYLKNGCRHSDIVARYGGEEFVICFPDTSTEQAYKLMERLRSDWAEKEIVIEGQVIKSTFSVGVVQWLPGRDVIADADKLLYQAKHNGRNQVCCDRDAPVPLNPLAQLIDLDLEDTIITPGPIPMPDFGVVPKKNPGTRMVAIWNNDGRLKAEAALEIAKKHPKAVLLEYDFVNPRLDELMRVPNPSKEDCLNKMPYEVGAGILTFGDTLTVDIATKLIHQYQYAVNYLPAGNNLGITTKLPVQVLIDLMDALAATYQQVVIDLGTDMENVINLAVLRRADVILVPCDQPNEFLKKQVDTLKAAGLSVEYCYIQLPRLSRPKLFKYILREA